jgi:hypothetical protein
VKRFMKGLNPYMRMQLRLTGHHKFQGIVDATITLEYDYKSVQEERRKKARAEPKRFPDQKPTLNLTFKARPRLRNPNPNPNRGCPNPKNNVRCHSCGVKGHYKSECRQPKVICYGCGQPRHMKPSCPNKQNFTSPMGGNRPLIRTPASKGRNPGDNKGKPYGKLNCTSVAEVIHSVEAVVGT